MDNGMYFNTGAVHDLNSTFIHMLLHDLGSIVVLSMVYMI